MEYADTAADAATTATATDSRRSASFRSSHDFQRFDVGHVRPREDAVGLLKSEQL